MTDQFNEVEYSPSQLNPQGRFMKLIRSIFTTVAVLSTLMLIGCGSKNSTSSGSYSSTGMWSGTSVGSGDLQNIMNQVISQTNSQRPCQQGTRLPTVHFKANVYNTNTLVAQNSQAITYPSGQVYEFYIGLSNFGDAMVVSKHDAGYVISLAMCPYGNSLTTSRPITAFTSPYGIVLGNTTTSKMGTILAAKETAVLLSASGAYQSMWFGPTTFFPVTIK